MAESSAGAIVGTLTGEVGNPLVHRRNEVFVITAGSAQPAGRPRRRCSPGVVVAPAPRGGKNYRLREGVESDTDRDEVVP